MGGHKFEMTLNSPMTEEDWNKITDVNMEHTKAVTFQTSGGKEVEFIRVTHGQWKDNIACSNCGWMMIDDILESRWLVAFPYCPNCGAKMDGDESPKEEEV